MISQFPSAGFTHWSPAPAPTPLPVLPRADKSAVLCGRLCKTVKDRSILVGQTVANLYTVHARDYVAIATS